MSGEQCAVFRVKAYAPSPLNYCTPHTACCSLFRCGRHVEELVFDGDAVPDFGERARVAVEGVYARHAHVEGNLRAVNVAIVLEVYLFRERVEQRVRERHDAREQARLGVEEVSAL